MKNVTPLNPAAVSSRGPQYTVTIDSPLIDLARGQHLAIQLKVNDLLVGLQPDREARIDYIMKEIRPFVEGLLVAEEALS